MVDRFIFNVDDYVEQKAELATIVNGLAAEQGFSNCNVSVNAGDDVVSGSIYLTVTGTSAEAGDDGQVGRGNRVNGLITPCRAMSLEAAAGKNPVSHVGKLYNVLARDVAERIVAQCPDVASAECLLVSKIGAPVSEPAFVQVKLATKDGMAVEALRMPVEAIIADRLQALPDLSNRLVAGEVTVF
jgi:S-adenosylmethionine synthetase